MRHENDPQSDGPNQDGGVITATGPSREESDSHRSGDAGNRRSLNRRPSLIINAMSNWAGFAVNTIIGILLTPFVIDRLGKSGYGIWTLVASIIGYYGLLDLGVSSSIRRYAARYVAQKDYRSLNETISTALVMFLFAGAIAIGLSIVLAGPLATFFELSPQRADGFRVVMITLGFAAGISMIGRLFRAIIAAHEFFVARNCIIIATTLIRAGFVVWALSSGMDLFGIAVGYLLSDIVAFCAYLVLTKWLTTHVRIRFSLVSLQKFRVLLVFGLTTTIIVVSDIVRFNIDSLVIGKMIGMEAVAVYAVAALVIRYFGTCIRTSIGVLGPRFAGLHGVNATSQFRALLVKSLWISSLLACSLGAVILATGGRFIHLWVGPEFEGAVLVLMMLILGSTVGLAQAPAVNALYAMNKHKYFAVLTVAEAICNLVLSILLAPRYGILGVAIGTMAPNLTIKLVVQPLYMARITGIGWLDYCRPVIVSLGIGAAVYGASPVFHALPICATGYLGLCFLAGFMCCLYAAIFLACYATARMPIFGKMSPLVLPSRRGK